MALQIALVHLLYNVVGVLVFTLVPYIRDWPVRSAEWLGHKTEENRSWALAYLFSVFFVLPGTVFAGEYLFAEPDEGIRESLEKDGVTDEVEEEELAIE